MFYEGYFTFWNDCYFIAYSNGQFQVKKEGYTDSDPSTVVFVGRYEDCKQWLEDKKIAYMHEKACKAIQ